MSGMSGEPSAWLAPEAADRQTLAKAFRTRTAAEWEEWATVKGLPITALRDATA